MGTGQKIHANSTSYTPTDHLVYSYPWMWRCSPQIISFSRR